MTFPNYKFKKGQYAFYPVKLSRFAEKKSSSSETTEFHEGDPYDLGRRPLQRMKNYKSQSFSREVLVIQGTINCAILESGIGGSGDPRRKWESERGRERKRERESVLKSVAFVCKMI